MVLSAPEVGSGAGLLGDLSVETVSAGGAGWLVHISEPHDHLASLLRTEEGLGQGVAYSEWLTVIARAGKQAAIKLRNANASSVWENKCVPADSYDE